MEFHKFQLKTFFSNKLLKRFADMYAKLSEKQANDKQANT